MHPLDRAVLASPPPAVAMGMGANPAAVAPQGIVAQLQSAIPSIPKTLFLGGITWAGAKIAEYIYAEYLVKGKRKRRALEEVSPLEDLDLEPSEEENPEEDEDDLEPEEEPDEESDDPEEDE